MPLVCVVQRGYGMSKLFFVVSLAVVVVACASKPSFNEQRDAAPAKPRDVSSVQNAVPTPVKRTIAGNKSPYTVLGKTYTLLPESHGYKAQGLASWYGQKFHGRYTSNGEVYDMYAMTAAHKTLPIPSFVKVTNLENGRSIVVKVNDRGPFHEGRIIDLSYAGAVKLDFLHRGTARVEVEDVTPSAITNVPYLRSSPLPAPVIPPPPAPTSELHEKATQKYLQLGAFSARTGADQLAVKVSRLFNLPVKITQGGDRLHRVLMGPLDPQLAETDIQRRLLESGLEQGYFVALP